MATHVQQCFRHDEESTRLLSTPFTTVQTNTVTRCKAVLNLYHVLFSYRLKNDCWFLDEKPELLRSKKKKKWSVESSLNLMSVCKGSSFVFPPATSRFFSPHHLIQNQAGKSLNLIVEENVFGQMPQKVKALNAARLSDPNSHPPWGDEEEQMEIHLEKVGDVCFLAGPLHCIFRPSFLFPRH